MRYYNSPIRELPPTPRQRARVSRRQKVGVGLLILAFSGLPWLTALGFIGLAGWVIVDYYQRNN